MLIFLHSKCTSLNRYNEILEDIEPHLFQQLAVLFSSLSLRGWSKHSIRYQLTSVVCGEDGRRKNSGCQRRVDKKSRSRGIVKEVVASVGSVLRCNEISFQIHTLSSDDLATAILFYLLSPNAL